MSSESDPNRKMNTPKSVKRKMTDEERDDALASMPQAPSNSLPASTSQTPPPKKIATPKSVANKLSPDKLADTLANMPSHPPSTTSTDSEEQPYTTFDEDLEETANQMLQAQAAAAASSAAAAAATAPTATAAATATSTSTSTPTSTSTSTTLPSSSPTTIPNSWASSSPSSAYLPWTPLPAAAAAAVQPVYFNPLVLLGTCYLYTASSTGSYAIILPQSYASLPPLRNPPPAPTSPFASPASACSPSTVCTRTHAMDPLGKKGKYHNELYNIPSNNPYYGKSSHFGYLHYYSISPNASNNTSLVAC